MNVNGHISEIEAMFGHHFRNKLLCVEALNMKEPNCPLRVGGVLHLFNKNRELELVGDAVSDAVLVKIWFEARDSNVNRRNLGPWTQMRNDLVSNKKFTERGFSLGLDKLIIKNLGIRSPSDDMVANTFEAVLGAIYMDAEEDAFAAVRDALEQTGFLHHHLLGGTSPTQSTTAA